MVCLRLLMTAGLVYDKVIWGGAPA
jgi:hypothetical protein